MGSNSALERNTLLRKDDLAAAARRIKVAIVLAMLGQIAFIGALVWAIQP
jgi:hypothetical protein